MFEHRRIALQVAPLNVARTAQRSVLTISICGLDAPGDLFYLYLVPSPAKNAGPNNPAKPENLPFEAALKKLEAIVEAMESEDLPLETLLGKYEEGTHLARVCQEKLAEAELKIQQLERNVAGEMKLKPLSPEESEQV